MNSQEWARVESLYLEASALGTSERSLFLDRTCAGQSGLRGKVEGMLRADAARPDFLVHPPSRLAAEAFEKAEDWPELIGPYRTLGVLGQGGMGTVYKAEQESPLRIVALKVIRPGMVDCGALRRFVQESEVLARLQHPGIAQVYHAGAADGQAYFAMEFIEGRPLLAYAAEKSLATKDRLGLMMKICDAVQHAHQRGILHRDLKPGNILVDESGQPKILDFGVARILDSDSRVTRQTDLGQLIGTLDYMSPEQTLGDPLGMDVRSDIYSLGVILYELLAGRKPYETKQRTLPELVRAIREEDPEPLSTINRGYRGDVETIVEKALEKEKNRRYASAAELGEDIRRHMAHEPILAMPASASYRAAKFFRRYRTGVVVGGVFLLMLLGFATGMAILAMRTTRERDIARTERERADAVVDFLQNDVLAQANSDAQSGPTRDPNLKVRDALDRAAARIEGKFETQPLVEASIRQTIGETYTIVGVLPSAAHQLEQALEIRRRLLGNDHLDTIATMASLGSIYRSEGIAQGEPLLREALRTGTRVLGEQHPVVLKAMSALVETFIDLARPKEAEELLGKAIEIQRRVQGSDGPATIANTIQMAVVYTMQGEFPQAEQLYLQVIDAQSKHPRPAPEPFSNLGNLYERQGRFKEAETYLQKAMDIASRTMNEERPFRLYMLESMGALYRDVGRFDEAEANFQQVWRLRRRVIGEGNRNTLSDLFYLGDLYCTENKWAPGEKMLLEAVDAQARLLGDGHRFTLRTMSSLSLCYLRQDKLDSAEQWASKAAEIQRRQFGASNYNTRDSLRVLADIQLRKGRISAAESSLKDACAVQSNDWQGFYCETLVGASLAARELFAKAEPLLVSGYQGLLKTKSSIPAGRLMHVAHARAELTRLYRDRKGAP